MYCTVYLFYCPNGIRFPNNIQSPLRSSPEGNGFPAAHIITASQNLPLKDKSTMHGDRLLPIDRVKTIKPFRYPEMTSLQLPLKDRDEEAIRPILKGICKGHRGAREGV